MIMVMVGNVVSDGTI